MIIGRCLICSPLPYPPLSFINALLPAHPWSLHFAGGRAQASGRERRSTLASLLSLDVRTGFGAVRKPNRTEPKPQFFPKNLTKN